MLRDDLYYAEDGLKCSIRDLAAAEAESHRDEKQIKLLKGDIVYYEARIKKLKEKKEAI